MTSLRMVVLGGRGARPFKSNRSHEIVIRCPKPCVVHRIMVPKTWRNVTVESIYIDEGRSEVLGDVPVCAFDGQSLRWHCKSRIRIVVRRESLPVQGSWRLQVSKRRPGIRTRLIWIPDPGASRMEIPRVAISAFM